MNFVDTNVYRGNRFEIKKNFEFFNQILANKQLIFYILYPLVFKGFIKLDGKKIRHLRYTNVSCEFKTMLVNFKLTSFTEAI